MSKDTEIEIKIPLKEDDFLKIKDVLSKDAKFLKAMKQKDDYFSPTHRNFLEPEFPFEWLSIRRRGDKTILNYKHFYPENKEAFTHCDEFETVVENPEKLRKLFSSLNFRKLVTVEKEREVYTHGDMFEVALDTVSELGHFIEIEAVKNLDSVEKTRNKLLEFAQELDLDISKVDRRGYPYLLMKKRGLIKQ